jgi:hypothetical protein
MIRELSLDLPALLKFSIYVEYLSDGNHVYGTNSI